MTSKKEGEEDVFSFEHDLKLLEQFHNFGAEIIRLSLAATAVVAFFAALTDKDTGMAEFQRILASSSVQTFLGWGFGLLGLAIASALAHRYFSADSMVSYLEGLRAKARRDEADAQKHRLQTRWRLAISGPLLGIATLALATGSACMATVFFLVLRG